MSARDPSSLANLLKAFLHLQPRLRSAAQSRTGSRAIAEDLVQDTWVKLQTARSDLPIDNPSAFMRQVANNLFVDHVRKQRRRLATLDEVAGLMDEVTETTSPERVAMGREHLRAVTAVLDGLPQRTRDIFLMNRLGGVSHRQIARRLDISEEAVYYHVRRALERLSVLRDELGI